MDIKLDDILQLKDDELNSSRIELNITAGRRMVSRSLARCRSAKSN